MPRVITVDKKNVTQGHCWEKTIPLPPPKAVTNPVFIEKKLIVRVGDAYQDHVPGCTDPPSTHPVVPIQGSNNVFVNNLPLVRDGDPMGCGDVANGGSPTVFANGGGSRVGEDPDNTVGFTRSIPEIEYPGGTITIPYWVYVQNELEIFGAGCSFFFSPLDAYTPLKEDNGTIYRNRPGPPITTRSGADLPSYADQSARRPIVLTLGISGQLPQNVNFFSDGSIGGKIVLPGDIELFQGSKITIQVSNYVGAKTTKLTLNFQKNYYACP